MIQKTELKVTQSYKRVLHLRIFIIFPFLFLLSSCASYHAHDLKLAKRTGAKIVINDYSPSSPNSAGGRNAVMKWTNTSNKTIKYIWFHVEAYNAVGDIEVCSITKKQTTTLRAVGPIEHGQGGSSGFGLTVATSWPNVWYNWSIRRIHVTKIDIEYMDGTDETLQEDKFHIVRERTLRN